MVVYEKIEIRGKTYDRAYSDVNKKIAQDGTGIIYDEAIDPENSGRTYTETDIPIETGEDI